MINFIDCNNNCNKTKIRIFPYFTVTPIAVFAYLIPLLACGWLEEVRI